MAPNNTCTTCEKSSVIDQTAKDVDEIKAFLLGDEFHPDGIKQKTARNAKRILRIERIMWTVSGAVAVIIFILKVII
ncbi:hypothetical protein LCGC14_0278620 [marine sediment metagenome]|uniref:Uncharacterized protein n=1 Tax=marine sediment metagenome TaxID=412755 RepID=A0A0F9U1U7_9ZZZZ